LGCDPLQNWETGLCDASASRRRDAGFDISEFLVVWDGWSMSCIGKQGQLRQWFE
jgi:hypothetical protein